MLLLDTHIIIWIVARDRRLTPAQVSALQDPRRPLIVSAAISYELTHLQADGRIPVSEQLSELQELIGFEIVDLPAACWSVVAQLPMIHRDPIDRMLVAHAKLVGGTIVSADQSIRRYPVPVI